MPSTLKNQPPAPEPSLRSVVPAYPPCYRALRKGRGSPVNVALRLTSLCPPTFQPIHFAPRTQTARKSSFARRPSASDPISKFPCCRPFVFMVLRIAFPANPLFSKTSALPPLVCPPNRFSQAQLRRLADRAHLSSSLSINCALLFSLPALFRTPALYFQQLADSLCKNRGGGGTLHIRTYAQLSLRVLCGASAFPALSFPSFVGPKNADAR